ncbi:2-amino-thiazoline-4-carboxylic acid hydrolase [Rhodospirillum rubrum]|uniref:L-2-amino-thiazoline-4-carboxylic acid hydrolase n=1 Tax=Rhodospirillum rubrum TaxID=1085 RepID=UPI001905EFF4|nr:L-2-amino-thiazoline-4-carboxylic acid hydrolase [Rhodospirillum rubrum]MBK1663870.1 2-amino-thiazoline-4-carboxylic acid hydrolase [Rhodospirillum rubrum]MBK1675886.1 2-amino-thiazoline-4-carboxylic acid hydrolase [Rhodospirillum rubrum]
MSISILEQRRIEAAFAKGVFDEMAARLGEETAREILGAAVIRMATAHGRASAAEITAQGRPADMEAFADILPRWQAGGALEFDVVERGAEAVSFDVTRCKYAEMYREMGVEKIGDLLSCNRDATFIEGFNPDATMERTQTIMKGGRCCDFRYHLKTTDTENAQ